MKVSLFLFIALIVSGCFDRKLVSGFIYVCDKEPLRKDILECIEKGNPKSDEEPEDLVSACNSVFRVIHCTEQIRSFRYLDRSSSYCHSDSIPCTEAKTQEEKRLCADWVGNTLETKGDK